MDCRQPCNQRPETPHLGDVDTFIAIARTFLTTLAASELFTSTGKLRAHW